MQSRRLTPWSVGKNTHGNKVLFMKKDIPKRVRSVVQGALANNIPAREWEEVERMLAAMPFVTAVGFPNSEDATPANVKKQLVEIQAEVFGLLYGKQLGNGHKPSSGNSNETTCRSSNHTDESIMLV